MHLVGYCHLPYLARGHGKPQNITLHLMRSDTPFKLVTAKHISLVPVGNSQRQQNAKVGKSGGFPRLLTPHICSRDSVCHRICLLFPPQCKHVSPIWYQFKISSFLHIMEVFSGCRFDFEKLWVDVHREDAVCLYRDTTVTSHNHKKNIWFLLILKFACAF